MIQATKGYKRLAPRRSPHCQLVLTRATHLPHGFGTMVLGGKGQSQPNKDISMAKSLHEYYFPAQWVSCLTKLDPARLRVSSAYTGTAFHVTRSIRTT